MTDKILHFAAGFIIALGFTIVMSPIYGLAAGVSAGIAKELWDEFDYGGADFWDFFATLAGVFVALFGYGLYVEVLA